MKIKSKRNAQLLCSTNQQTEAKEKWRNLKTLELKKSKDKGKAGVSSESVTRRAEAGKKKKKKAEGEESITFQEHC